MKKRGHFLSEEGEKQRVYLLLTVQKIKENKKAPSLCIQRYVSGCICISRAELSLSP